MPLNSLKTEEPTSPSSNSRFVVDLGNGLKPIAFQEISGLNAESKVLEYRNINSPHFTTEKMPGITKYDNIILKKAVLVADQTFWNWHDQIESHTVQKGTIRIKLLDEEGKIAMQWILDQAWPIMITIVASKSDTNELSIESLEIAHEKITVVNM